MEKNTGKLFTPVHGTPMDYLRWRGDLTFRQDGFNEVDNLVLCIISYINFRRITAVHTTEPSAAPTLAQVAPLLTEEDDQLGLSELSYLPLVQLAAKTPRFRGVRLFAYTHEYDEAQAKQFDALSFLLPDGTLFVAFMGTDTSLAGWKEDFLLGCQPEVPAQKKAVAYVKAVAGQYPRRKLMLGGHSKGGNLAVYGGIFVPLAIQRRISAVWSNDGPGFYGAVLETPQHARLEGRIHSIVPKSSVVGMLLEHEESYTVVDSDQTGLWQHDGFSWQVLGTQFVHLDDVSREGKLVDEALSAWADSLNTQQREALADALYSVFTASGAKTLSDLNEEKLKSAAAMLKTYKNLDRETRRMVTEALMLFFRLSTKSFVLDTQEESSREIENIRRKISEQYQKLLERKK